MPISVPPTSPIVGSFNFCSFHILPDDFIETSVDTLLSNNINSLISGEEWLLTAVASGPTTFVTPSAVSYSIDASQYSTLEIDTLPFSSTVYTLTVDTINSSTIVNGTLTSDNITSTNITNSGIISTNTLNVTTGINFGTNTTSPPNTVIISDSGGHQLWANPSSLITSQSNIWTAGQRGQYVYLVSSGGIINLDMDSGNNFSVVMTENSTLNSPVNSGAGQSGIIVIQNGTTPSTLTFNSYWKFAGGVAPTLTPTANAVDVLSYMVSPSGNFAICQILNDIK